MRDPIAEFKDYNRPFARRNPELLRFKVARMAAGPFAFFRGTFHLFARDLIDKVGEAVPVLPRPGAEMDLVGDIHSENYGTYKAEDGPVVYDINDFDETTRGRFDFDVCRLATSLFLASRERGDSLADAVQVPLACLTAYTEAVSRFLKKGKEPAVAVSDASPAHCPPVDELIRSAAAAKRPAFIEKITEVVQGHRRLLRSRHYFNLPDPEREQALRLVEDYRGRNAKVGDKGFFAVEDVCGRVSGIGSMGRFRYVALVAGKGSREGRNVLLEFKEARPSAYDILRQRETDAAALAGRAERVITVQRQSQVSSSPYLGFAVDGGMSFQVREIGPHDARIDSKALPTPAALQGVAKVQAGILARTHARASARTVGLPHPLDQLDDPDAFNQRVMAFVLAYADVTQQDWKRFVAQRAELEQCETWAGEAGG
jgi:uncharacterized protein (DUF2252 family)